MKSRIKYEQGDRPYVLHEEDFVYRGKSGLWYMFDEIPKNGFPKGVRTYPWVKYVLKNGQVRYFGPQQRKV